MSLPDPIPDELTIKQVAERWRLKYGNPADENYVLACYGKLKFCRLDLPRHGLVNYSRDEFLARVKEESPFADYFKFVEELPKYEKTMLRVRKSDLLTFEQSSKELQLPKQPQPERVPAVEAPAITKPQQSAPQDSAVALAKILAGVGTVALYAKVVELEAAKYLQSSPIANNLLKRHATLQQEGKLNSPNAAIAQPKTAQEGNEADTPAGKLPREEKAGNIVGPKPISRNHVMGKFRVKEDADENIKFWDDKLGRPPKWLEPARVHRGKPGHSSLWNPLLLAHCLLDKKEMTLRQLNMAMHEEFPELYATWKRETEDV